MARNRFPMFLELLPGLRWKGKLQVNGPHGGGWACEFNAEDVDPVVVERFIFDHAVLTTKQVKDWTGVDL